MLAKLRFRLMVLGVISILLLFAFMKSSSNYYNTAKKLREQSQNVVEFLQPQQDVVAQPTSDQNVVAPNVPIKLPNKTKGLNAPEKLIEPIESESKSEAFEPIESESKSEAFEPIESESKSEAFYEKTYDFHAVPYMFKKSLRPIFQLGKGPSHKVSIIAGIPSVRRPKIGLKYLYQTLNTLLHNMYPVNEDDIAVVVFLAESDLDYVKTEAKYIYGNFTRQVDSGLLQLISPDPSMYPDFYSLPKTLGDSPERIKWRSKEVFDAAYLMYYSTNKADYYLMLEDDVLAARGYVTAAKQFASKYESIPNYSYLLLSIWDSKAVLFRMRDVPKWVTYFFTFFGDKPIDWLMFDFVYLMACYPGLTWEKCWQGRQAKMVKRPFGLFQHIGKVSSLTIKSTNQIDPNFRMEVPAVPNPHKNPPADVVTTLKAVGESSHITALYEDSGGMNKQFFAAVLGKDDFIAIKFKEQEIISKILIKTGRNYREKFPSSVALEYQVLNSDNYQQCAVFDHNGEAECRFANQPIQNIRIRVLDKQRYYVWIQYIFVASQSRKTLS